MKDELTKLIQKILLVYFFVDNIVLVNKIRSGVNAELEIWQDTLESKDIHLNVTKIEYMECNLIKLKIETNGQ